MSAYYFWMTVGFVGQALFGLRMLVQWLASERARERCPPLFWHISVPAGLLLFAYAAWRQDPVFILNEGVCVLISSATSSSCAKKEKQRPAPTIHRSCTHSTPSPGRVGGLLPPGWARPQALPSNLTPLRVPQSHDMWPRPTPTPPLRGGAIVALSCVLIPL
jgi:lipid-A-disaccharide synthase-like uncharacterized protein